MKKIILVLMLGMFLAGCGSMGRQSEFWKHDTIWKNWDHFKYSMYGFKEPEDKYTEMTDAQEWWGIPIDPENNKKGLMHL